MISIQKTFIKLKELNPYWSSYNTFATTIKNKNYTPRVIQHWFNILVEKDDYTGIKKGELFKNLEELSNPLRKVENEGDFDLGDPQIINNID